MDSGITDNHVYSVYFPFCFGFIQYERNCNGTDGFGGSSPYSACYFIGIVSIYLAVSGSRRSIFFLSRYIFCFFLQYLQSTIEFFSYFLTDILKWFVVYPVFQTKKAGLIVSFFRMPVFTNSFK